MAYFPFHCVAYDYSRADWDGLRNHLRDVPWEDIFFKVSASASASEFCEWIQVGIDVYIPWLQNACSFCSQNMLEVFYEILHNDRQI